MQRKEETRLKNKYYNLVQSGNEADITIYGDITSMEWFESDMSAHTLRSDLDAMGAVDHINVHINSYGGEVAEGLAIFNSLKNHPAKVTTYCDGFACSIASVIFMAGDERVMNNASLLMIHNAWSGVTGNADDMRKAADDLDIITQQIKNAYLAKIDVSEDELSALMDAESWITPADAVAMGFATSVTEDDETTKASANARKTIMGALAVTLIDNKCNETEDVPENLDEEPETISDSETVDTLDEEADGDNSKIEDNAKPENAWANFFK